MNEIDKKEDTKLETFLHMLRTTRFCAKQCGTLKVDRILDEKDNECLSLHFFCLFFTFLFFNSRNLCYKFFEVNICSWKIHCRGC